MDKKYFTKRSDLLSLAVVFSHVIVVLAPIYISVSMELGVVTFLCWAFFGVSMHGMMNLMHEACHYHVFKHKQASEILGKYVLAPLVFADFEGYRQRHWDHHKHLGVEGDTKDAYLIDIKGLNIFTIFLQYLFPKQAIAVFLKQFKVKKQEESTSKRNFRWILTALIFQILLFSSLLFTAHHFYASQWSKALIHTVIIYTFVYLYALVSLTVMMAHLRSIAEHQHDVETESIVGRASLRNFKCNIFTRYLLGSYGFGEHYTHHKIPGIPYYHLREITHQLAKEDDSLRPQIGYFKLLTHLMKTTAH